MANGPHSDQRVHAVACAVVTVSDTRTPATDRSGSWIRDQLTQAGHRVVSYEIFRDEPAPVRDHVAGLCGSGACSVVLVTGGTGIAARDSTYEAVAGLLEKRLDGFGELFRTLSFEAIGPAAILSRAVAGVCARAVVFSMPGSPAAVELAMTKLVLPVLGHVAWLLRPDQRP